MRQEERHGAKILVYYLHRKGTFDLLKVLDKRNVMGPKYCFVFFIGRVLLRYLKCDTKGTSWGKILVYYLLHNKSTFDLLQV